MTIVFVDKSFADLVLYVRYTWGTLENNPQQVPITDAKFAISWTYIFASKLILFNTLYKNVLLILK